MAREVFHHVPLIQLFSSLAPRFSRETTPVGCIGLSVNPFCYFLPFTISHLQCQINLFHTELHSPPPQTSIHSIMGTVSIAPHRKNSAEMCLSYLRGPPVSCGFIIPFILLFHLRGLFPHAVTCHSLVSCSNYHHSLCHCFSVWFSAVPHCFFKQYFQTQLL